jgi:hypothetical protein
MIAACGTSATRSALTSAKRILAQVCQHIYLVAASVPRCGSTGKGIDSLFISAKATTTMEFLSRSGSTNGNFMSLGRERDPNVGL